MARQKKSRSMTFKFAAVAGTLVLVSGIGWLGWRLHRSTPSLPVDTNNATAGLSSKKDVPVASSNSNQTSNQVPISAAASMVIDTLTESNDDIILDSTVTNIAGGGTCVVTFSKENNKPVVHQFSPQAVNGTLHCKSSDISALEFSELGDWTAVVRYYQADSQVTATQSITIT